MSRRVWLALPCAALVLLAGAGFGDARSGEQATYEQRLAAALKLERDVPPGGDPVRAYYRAYEALADVVVVAPERWEAYFWRGLNRCQAAEEMRCLLRGHLEKQRLARVPEARLEELRLAVNKRIAGVVTDQAHPNFKRMLRQMKRCKQHQPDLVRFASLAMKMALGEYRAAKAGAPGAIQDLKSLLFRNPPQLRTEVLRNMIARAYIGVGLQACDAGRLDQACRSWSAARRWTANAALLRIVRENIAAVRRHQQRQANER